MASAKGMINLITTSGKRTGHDDRFTHRCCCCSGGLRICWHHAFGLAIRCKHLDETEIRQGRSRGGVAQLKLLCMGFVRMEASSSASSQVILKSCVGCIVDNLKSIDGYAYGSLSPCFAIPIQQMCSTWQRRAHFSRMMSSRLLNLGFRPGWNKW